jgi:hypothetical protein
MEIIIAMAVAAYVVRHGAELVAAITGKQTDWQKAQAHRVESRTAVRAARAARAGEKPPKQRSAFREYLGLLWEDGWSDAQSKHSVRRARRQARRDDGSSRDGAARFYLRQLRRDGWAAWDRRWDAATERRKAKTRPYEPSPESPIVPGVVVPVPDDLSDLRVGKPEDDTKPQDPQSDVDGAVLITDDTTGQPATTPQKENPMSITANGEVTGLDSSVEFCKESGNNASIIALALEQVRAFLEASKIQGEVLGHLSGAQENFTAAADKLGKAEKLLDKGYAVRDAMEAAGDAAGDKQFTMSS